jgi:hypothetical protein
LKLQALSKQNLHARFQEILIVNDLLHSVDASLNIGEIVIGNFDLVEDFYEGLIYLTEPQLKITAAATSDLFLQPHSRRLQCDIVGSSLIG